MQNGWKCPTKRCRGRRQATPLNTNVGKMKFKDYQLSELPKNGFFDEPSQYWILRKKEEFEEKSDI